MRTLIRATLLALVVSVTGCCETARLALDSPLCPNENPLPLCEAAEAYLEEFCNDPNPDTGGEITVTFRIHNNSTECSENTLYYKLGWSIEDGTDESGVTAVPPGGVSTFFIPAYDPPDNGTVGADLVTILYTVFDPDPDWACAIGEASYENGVLKDGDMLEYTVHADGTWTEEIIPAQSSLVASALNSLKRLFGLSDAAAPARELTPTPDPHASQKPSDD